MTSIHTPVKADSHEYPGVYSPPLYNWKKVMEQLKDTPAVDRKPAVDICDSQDFYCIQLKAPGFSKEDFIVTIDGSKLNIYGLSSSCSKAGPAVPQAQDKIYDCFEHVLDLPGNIDSDFVRAEYKSGVLRFDFPKTAQADKCTVEQIVVY